MPQLLRVLQVEDSESDAELIKRLLKKAGYDVQSLCVDNREDLLAALHNRVWDVIIADYTLPQFDAPAALEVVRGSGLDVPFLVVSGHIGEERVVEMMRNGAHDYLMKNNLTRLAPAVERETREARIRKERRQAEALIRKELQEKEVLLKEIHHRVKNNLQIVSSLLNMQGKRVRGNQAKTAFRESEYRVQSMAMIHEFLYQNSTFSQLDLVAYLRRVADYLAASYGVAGVYSFVTGEPAYLNLDQAIPCGLIVNELVSNCYKHAFPAGKGTIRVEIHQESERFQVAVEDNGTGVSDEFRLSGSKSLGLQLIETLAIRQLHGALDIQRGDGTRFVLTFELPEAAGNAAPVPAPRQMEARAAG
ncbi:MAG: response regulator [Acidobacteria bacterium]|nr:response regulator [Acidobacteriota bacterium]